MRKFTIFIVILLVSRSLLSQVAINNDQGAANASAGLDVKFPDKGVLIPRMTFIQRTSINPPATGLLLYQTDGVQGFWHFNGTEWQSLTTSFGNGSINYIAKSIASDLFGNSQLYENFPDVGIGTINPKSALNINGGLTIGYTGAMGTSYGATKNTLRISSEISLGGNYGDHPVGLIYSTLSSWSNRRLVFALAESWDSYNTTRPTFELINDYTLVNELNIRASTITGWSGTINFQNESGHTHSRYGVNLDEQYGYFRIGGTITTDQMRLYSTGKLYIENDVGIGTLNPAKTLDVNGATRSRTSTGTDPDNGQFQAYTWGTAQGQRAVYSFYPTFENTPADNGPRRAADILSGFNGGAWGKEYLAFHVGGSDNAFAMTTERMRITADGNAGIGTTSPHASAQLEVSSTSKGFLMPRMNDTEMNAIQSPAAGLMVFNTTKNKPYYYTGEEWKTSNAPELLENYGGGIVFYIDESGYHGLIADMPDYQSQNDWGCPCTCIDGANHSYIGAGYKNTNEILADCPEASYAAKTCYNSTHNGYSDWFLPSKEELEEMLLYKLTLGLAQDDYHWSSTEPDYCFYECVIPGLEYYAKAIAVHMGTPPIGDPYIMERPKNESNYVRCIRSF